MKIAVIGTGYVGLVTGACFAEMGHTVICVDSNEKIVSNLNKGVIPIHEPRLPALVERNFNQGRLIFTISLDAALINEPELCFIAVGTPSGANGEADLFQVRNVARQIGESLKSYCVIADKSTVPVGTAEMVRSIISEELRNRNENIEFDVVSNPEFLKEGDAVSDCMKPDRIIVGTDSGRAEEVMRRLYKDFSRSHDKFMVMGIRDAEMTKYAANAMLATKISFMNEIANICDRLGVDVENVRLGIGSDSRIGFSFIYPGCGYGGSCFPKDVKALIQMAGNPLERDPVTPMILSAVDDRNELQKETIFWKMADHFGMENFSGRKFAFWGLSFKPETDDVREAPAIVLIKMLIDAGAEVCAYDPIAMENAKKEFPPKWIEEGLLRFGRNQYEVLDGVDALVLTTEWKEFRHPDLSSMVRMMKGKIIFDGRNIYDPNEVTEAGFEYFGIGRRGVARK